MSIKGFKQDYPNNYFFEMKKINKVKYFFWENVDEENNIYSTKFSEGKFENAYHNLLENVKEDIRESRLDLIIGLLPIINNLGQDTLIHTEIEKKDIDRLKKLTDNFI